MENEIGVKAEELSKREKYRERRGEEYDIVSKVAFLIGVPDSHWKSQYTGLDSDIYEQLSDNRDARIIRNLCGLRTEIERNFKRFSMLILMELKNLHTIPQTQGMVNQLRKDEIDIIKANPKLEEYLPKINALLQQHIDACKSLFPIWVKHTKATIEHQMSERVLTGKSLVDVMLVAGCCKEHYVNKVDSFLLFSSDSDYWGLISSVSTAKFLVMVEQNKVSGEIVQKMIDSDIPFCYLDQFCQGGQSHKMKVDALLSECQRFVSKHFESFNVQEMVNVALLQTRIEMSKAEQKQFYERYIKTMRLNITADGMVNIEFEG